MHLPAAQCIPVLWNLQLAANTPGVNRILLFLGMAVHTNSFFKGTVWRENYGIPSCAALRLNKNLTGFQFCDQRTIICHNLLFGNTHAIWHPSVQSSLFRHNYIFYPNFSCETVPLIVVKAREGKHLLHLYNPKSVTTNFRCTVKSGSTRYSAVLAMARHSGPFKIPITQCGNHLEQPHSSSLSSSLFLCYVPFNQFIK